MPYSSTNFRWTVFPPPQRGMPDKSRGSRVGVRTEAAFVISAKGYVSGEVGLQYDREVLSIRFLGVIVS